MVLPPRLRAVCAAVLAAVLLVLGEGQLPAQGAAPVRIMIEGDSIAQGLNGDYTWRYWLWKEFQRQGVPVDFVGTHKYPAVREGYTSASYAVPGFDSDHDSTLGAQIQGELGRAGAEVASQKPDVIVFAMGLNDLHNNATPQETLQRLRDWLAVVRAAKPDVRVVLSPVLTIRRPDLPWLSPLIDQYDELLASSLPDLSTERSPVTLADTRKNWEPTLALSWDGIHATPTGETVIAQNVAEELQRIGVLPRTPQVFHGFQPWFRNLAAQTRLINRSQIYVSWDHESASGARILLRRRGEPWRELPRTVKYSFKTGVLRPGTYDVRLREVRYAMVSAVGPVSTLRVPRVARHR